ncbi:MAG: SCO2322 family protein [Actinomycetota bacterium]|nr:SCO2322 family protein [Actinomycetota bacterium]
MKQSRRRAGAALASVLVGVLLSLTFVNTSQAAAYRYWTYWHVTDGAWLFAQAGPAGTTPLDGSVEGWRFAISSTSGDAANQPRVEAADAFDAICGATAAVEGKKRVALVVDPGLTEAAPPGDQPGPLARYCTVVDADANGYDVLRSVNAVRVGGGLICAINKYPSTECADVVDDSEVKPSATNDAMNTSPAAPADSTDQTSALPVIIGLGALVLLGVLAYRLRRRR